MSLDKDRIEIREQGAVSLVIHLHDSIKLKKATLQGKYIYSNAFSEPPFFIYIFMSLYHQKNAMSSSFILSFLLSQSLVN